tara:strand:- start:772 stop:1503 length:732 start_codon:yes stop_codon:yes gene_type:complete
MNFKHKVNNYITNAIGTTNGTTREAWLQATLEELRPNSSILDAGAGEAQFKKFCNHLKYTSQDIGIYDGSGDNKGLHTEKRDYSNLDIISDIYDLPLKDNSFDNIMCIEVLEHLDDPLKALKELSRVIIKDGNLILTAPFNSLTHYAPYHFHTGFTRYFYEKHLKELGFEIIEITPNGNFFQYIAQESRRLNSVVEKYSKKKLNVFEKVIVVLFLRILNKYSRFDSTSHELLCYGYQILAKKI